jgi:hypothetical protein
MLSVDSEKRHSLYMLSVDSEKRHSLYMLCVDSEKRHSLYMLTVDSHFDIVLVAQIQSYSARWYLRMST